MTACVSLSLLRDTQELNDGKRNIMNGMVSFADDYPRIVDKIRVLFTWRYECRERTAKMHVSNVMCGNKVAKRMNGR